MIIVVIMYFIDLFDTSFFLLAQWSTFLEISKHELYKFST